MKTETPESASAHVPRFVRRDLADGTSEILTLVLLDDTGDYAVEVCAGPEIGDDLVGLYTLDGDALTANRSWERADHAPQSVLDELLAWDIADHSLDAIPEPVKTYRTVDGVFLVERCAEPVGVRLAEEVRGGGPYRLAPECEAARLGFTKANVMWDAGRITTGAPYRVIRELTVAEIKRLAWLDGQEFADAVAALLDEGEAA